MPQVPITTSPQQVAPNLEPTPRYQANVDPAAFGVNVAQAVQGLGKATDNAGTEIYQRGIAMQDLYNHSEALEADAKYSEAAGQIYEKMKGLEGKNAVDYYTSGQYQQELHDARQQGRDGLSNPMAQKMYDASTLSTLTRTNLYGASYSGEQNRGYAAKASDARVAALTNRAQLNAKDDDAFDDAMSDAEDEIRTSNPAVRGQSPEAVEQAVATMKNNMWTGRMQALKNEPLRAGKLLNQAILDGDVQGDAVGKLQNLVQQYQLTSGARIVATQVRGGDLRWGSTPVDINQAKLAIAGNEQDARGYGTIGPTTKSGDRALGKYQIMESNLPEWLKEAGMPSMSGDEFLKNNAAQEQLFTSKFGGYMKQYGSFNAAAVAWFAGPGKAEDPSQWSRTDISDATPTTKGHTIPWYLTKANATLAKNAPLQQQYDMGAKIAAEQAPDNVLMPEAVQRSLESMHNTQRAAERDDEWNTRQPIETALMGSQGNGKLPTSVDELTSDPKVSAAWDHLAEIDPAKARYYLGILAHNAKGDYAPTAEGLTQKHTLIGMAQADPASFVDQDIVGLQMPLSWRNELMNLQDKIRKGSGGNPAVNHALSVLEGDMDAAHVKYNGKDKDNDDYYRFVGSLTGQLEAKQKIDQRPPKDEEIRSIGARLLQTMNPDRHFWQSEVRSYQTPVPKDEVPKIQADYAADHNGMQPTDLEIQRRYMARQYQKMHGKSVGASASAAPVPQVPRSQ